MKTGVLVLSGLAFAFVGVILSTVVGGVVGWIVGGVFPFVIDALNKVSGNTLTSFEMGAVLGFVGGFFRNTTVSKSA